MLPTEIKVDSSPLRPSTGSLDRHVPGLSSMIRRTGKVFPPSAETYGVRGARGTPRSRCRLRLSCRRLHPPRLRAAGGDSLELEIAISSNVWSFKCSASRRDRSLIADHSAFCDGKLAGPMPSISFVRTRRNPRCRPTASCQPFLDRGAGEKGAHPFLGVGHTQCHRRAGLAAFDPDRPECRLHPWQDAGFHQHFDELLRDFL